ncbi:MAG: protein-L-isoaspartate O-methyltransferase [Candidatus Scalindua rubra]|uniref:Protein-L-isoaspartate O-methyltransferase n=1 Tax=Candidatus Scalindua rubra TaxID=1872076 RepID=A0A1E3XAU7_9BACT|nr:MAG: protein-L-isoaspartate O-methyltransferase [Candidatus Scalindua rubra]
MKFIIFITIIIVLYCVLHSYLPFLNFAGKNSIASGKKNIESTEKGYAWKRKRMVEQQIIARGVRDKKVLEAMESVPRHLFVPKGYREYSYYDQPLPIGLGQTISQPYIVALMTEMLEVDNDAVVLEIGTGSGYQAAVLSTIVKEVYTIEIIKELGLKAEEKLKNLGYNNVNVKIADGSLGWPDKAPFDAIIVTAAAEKIPDPLVKQLKPGGRMVIPVDSSFFGQDLLIVEKDEAGNINIKKTIPVRFVPLVEGEEVTK